jgi:hypothetical protein
MDPMTEQTLMRRLRLPALAAILALAAAACAGASMDSDLGARYGVSVVNELESPMVVSLDDGATTRVLGTVAAGSESRFVLDGSRGTTITLIATDPDDTRTVRRTVVLEQGETVEVRLN